MKIKWFFIFAALQLAGYSFGQLPEKKIDDLIVNLQKKLQLESAIAVGVINDGKIIFEKVYGFANAPQKIAANVNTPFYIASTTKSYLSTLAVILEKEGKIKLDAPVAAYLPGFSFNNPALSVNKITIRDLLTHKAGLKSEAIVTRTGFTGEDADNADKLLELFKDCEFGTSEFAYTNLGYILAGIIFEKVTGKKWQDLLKEKILDPLKMNYTSASVWYLYKNKNMHPALGHTVQNETTIIGPLQKADINMHAAGGIFSSIKDSENWLLFHMNQYKGHKVILNSNDISSLHIPKAGFKSDFYTYRRFGYDMGWYHSTYEGDTLIQCFGSFPGGHRAHTSFMPAKGIGVVVFCNAYPEGVFLPDIIANYIYDNLTGKQNLEEKYQKEISNYTETVKKFKPAVSETPALINAAHKIIDENFTGTYYNAKWGTITLLSENGSSIIKWGKDALVVSKLQYDKDNRYKLLLTELFSPNDYLELVGPSAGQGPAIRMKKGNDEIIFYKKAASYEKK